MLGVSHFKMAIASKARADNKLACRWHSQTGQPAQRDQRVGIPCPASAMRVLDCCVAPASLPDPGIRGQRVQAIQDWI